MPDDFQTRLIAHRPALLRHCYRMLGSFGEAEDMVQNTLLRAWTGRDGYQGTAPVEHWLYTIATNVCLTELANRRRRALPQLESDAAGNSYVLGEKEAAQWITPAADRRMFQDPAEAAEARETVSLAFIALLQRLPARQRAALLMKDVLGWPAEEIATALGQSLPSVQSALHRGRKAVAAASAPSDEPPPTTLQAFVRAWETRDLDALVALLRDDVILAMPPHAVWFQGQEPVMGFLHTARFNTYWSTVGRVVPTRANGVPAFAFYRAGEGRALERHSIMVARFVAGQAAEMTVFIGIDYFAGFDLSPVLERTVSGASVVMNGKGGRS
ncbi:MAG TPA: RNA polymerase subunit sigma-70 [Polyangia bacterium]|nr:RNA polymerase subunit sigma-70 [Polyangia bacterium]